MTHLALCEAVYTVDLVKPSQQPYELALALFYRSGDRGSERPRVLSALTG